MTLTADRRTILRARQPIASLAWVPGRRVGLVRVCDGRRIAWSPWVSEAGQVLRLGWRLSGESAEWVVAGQGGDGGLVHTMIGEQRDEAIEQRCIRQGRATAGLRRVEPAPILAEQHGLGESGVQQVAGRVDELLILRRVPDPVERSANLR